jgi:hypothetical protein
MFYYQILGGYWSISANNGIYYVVAVEDPEYYDSQNREHGEMHPADEKVISETLGYML